jgi:hypothetical protein
MILSHSGKGDIKKLLTLRYHGDAAHNKLCVHTVRDDTQDSICGPASRSLLVFSLSLLRAVPARGL